VLPFEIGEATPDAEAFAVGKGLFEAVLANHALCADHLGSFLASGFD
jgi:hypothetical protein